MDGLEQRQIRDLPYRFTIQVRRASEKVWQASVDTDDGQERTFAANTEEEARERAEAYATEWALRQPGTQESYSYDFIPKIEEVA